MNDLTKLVDIFGRIYTHVCFEDKFINLSLCFSCVFLSMLSLFKNAIPAINDISTVTANLWCLLYYRSTTALFLLDALPFIFVILYSQSDPICHWKIILRLYIHTTFTRILHGRDDLIFSGLFNDDLLYRSRRLLGILLHNASRSNDRFGTHQRSPPLVFLVENTRLYLYVLLVNFYNHMMAYSPAIPRTPPSH